MSNREAGWCSSCNRQLGVGQGSPRLALLEGGRAWCSDCIWLVEHPEADGMLLGQPSDRSDRAPLDGLGN
jgi:hypothetical protein